MKTEKRSQEVNFGWTMENVPLYNQPKLDSGGEPQVVQHEHENFCLSYNPDDQKFYVSDKEINTLGRYTEFRNAVYKYKTLAGLIYRKGGK